MEIYNVNIILQMTVESSLYNICLNLKEQYDWNMMGEDSKTSELQASKWFLTVWTRFVNSTHCQ